LHSTQVTGEELQARNQALVKSIKEHLGSEGFAEFRTLSAQFQQVTRHEIRAYKALETAMPAYACFSRCMTVQINDLDTTLLRES
jgi:hypothetical protein